MLEDLTPRTLGPVPKIDKIRNGLDVPDQKLFDNYLTDVTRWSANELSLALTAQGINVSADTIRRYRQKHGLC